MSAHSAQQHKRNVAEYQPPLRPQFRRQDTTGPGKHYGLAPKDEHVSSNHGVTKTDHGERLSVENTVASSSGLTRVRAKTGKPALSISGELEASEYASRNHEVKSSAKSRAQLSQVGVQHASMAPFPQQVEPSPGRDIPKHKKATTQRDSPLRAATRRPSAAGRNGRNSSAVLKAEMLDCTPWIAGLHPEDRLTETIIKAGNYEKPVVQNETNTARPSLWPHLKNGSGIQGLSALFGTVLQRKRANGLVTTNSTFKPPPRVSLTDPKKETWLKDLSNPTFALHRLSRTIPYGIRGKALLEQCLAKDVPMARAVWLARCVGANELRAFRRKGISGAVMIDNETRWIREWTILVENFVQECFDSRLRQGWRARVEYAMRLTSRFNEEGLLDLDHILEWLLCNLRQYPLDKLPLATLMLRNYWRELTSSLKHMRRVAVGCLERLEDIRKLPHRDLYSSISIGLQQWIKLLLRSHPLSFLTFGYPKRLRDELSMIGTDNCGEALHVFEQISRRKSRIDTGRSQEYVAALPAQFAIIDILDSVQAPFSFDSLSLRLMSTQSNIQDVVTFVLHWATSNYRFGLHRPYIAIGLLRHLFLESENGSNYMLSSLAQLRNQTDIDPRSLSHVFTEMISSKDFDAGHYLRWLIASGLLDSQQNSQTRPSCDEQILRDISPRILTSSALSLRSMLLRNSRNSDDAARSRVEIFKQSIEKHASIIKSSIRMPQAASLPGLPPLLDRAETLQMGEIVGHRIIALITEHKAQLTIRSRLQEALPFTEIASLLQILETLEDFSTLGEMLITISKIADATLLVILAAVYEYNFNVFFAIKPTPKTCVALIQRYRYIRLTTSPIKPAALSLLNIATHLKVTDLIGYLENEVTMSDDTQALAAYTPISDIHLDTYSSSTIDTEDDLESMIASVATLDEKTMTRVLDLIAIRTDKLMDFGRPDALAFKSLVLRLRTSNEKLFDSLTLDWAFSRLSEGSHDAITATLSTLVAVGCLKFSILLRSAEDRCEAIIKSDIDKGAEIAGAMLEALIPLKKGGASDTDMFSFCRDYSHTLLRLLHRALHMQPHNDDDNSLKINQQVRSIVACPRVIEALQRSLLHDATTFHSELNINGLTMHVHTRLNARHLVFSLLDPKCYLGNGISSLSLDHAVNRLFETVDGFSLPFYQLGLHFLMASAAYEAPNGHTATRALLEAAKLATSRNSLFWPHLISRLDDFIKAEIRAFAERMLIDGIDSSLSVQLNSETYEALHRYLGIIKATSSSIPSVGDLPVAKKVLKVFDTLSELCAEKESIVEQEHIYDKDMTRRYSDPVEERIELLLDLSLIHSQSFHNSEVKCSLLTVLSNLLIMNKSRLSAVTLEHILDITTFFSTDLSSSEFNVMQDSLGSLVQHQLLRYIFGFRQPLNGWLHLTSTSAAISLGIQAVTDSASLQNQSENSVTNSLQQVQQQSRPSLPYPLRYWELLSNSTPNIGMNDTALSLRLFDARKV